ncbi:MAG: hypothetical protein MUQ20_01765, partial [Deltaproteobacteria bacterium]|nr:hypothetical protein [Deltaproteobacteria bacterium]
MVELRDCLLTLHFKQGEKEMMKKLGMFVFVMALVVAFALPAFAYTVEGAKGERFTMGGVLSYSIGYRNTNKDYNTYVAPSAGGLDKTELGMGVDYWSILYAQYTVGPASFYWRLYVNQDVGKYNKINDDSMTYGATEYTNRRDFIASDVFFGSYTFGNIVFSAGKMEQSTQTLGMSQRLGYTPSLGGHVAGIAYGYVYDQKYPQLRFRHNISKQFAYQISLVQAGTYAEAVSSSTVAGTTTFINAGTTYTVPTTANAGIRQSYSTIPMIAGKLIMNFGPVSLYPAFAYQQVQWDVLTAGWDTSMTAWLFRVPVKVAVGPFAGSFEITYGQNLGGGSQMANICSGEASYGGYQRNAAGKILNSNTLAGFVDLSMKFGDVTPHIYYGQTTSSNTDK